MTQTITLEEPEGKGIRQINAAIRSRIKAARQVFITSHIRPDGDAIGSLLGLGLAIQNLGKPVHMTLADAVPASFRHLQGSELIKRGSAADQITADDFVISVDVSDPQRVGGVFGDRTPDLNIDHHITNPNFSEINLVIPSMAATSAILAQYLPEWGLEIDEPIASALLTGIITDTIGYRTSNMTPVILRLSAMLMEHGANLPELYERGLITKSFEAARYWGQGLNRLQRVALPEGPVFVWSVLTIADRAETGYTGNDDADLVNFLSTVDSDLALLFNEQKNDHVKVSWRARPGIDVSKIALQFGGGGHPAAAGADIPGSIEIIQGQVLKATYTALTSHAENTKVLSRSSFGEQ